MTLENLKLLNLMYKLLYKVNEEMCINRLGLIVLKWQSSDPL